MEKRKTSDYRLLLSFLVTYIRPYWVAVLTLLFSYFIVTGLTAVQPMIMTPLLDVVLGEGTIFSNPADTGPIALKNVDLNNIGQFVAQYLHLGDMTTWQILIYLSVAYLIVSAVLYVFSYGSNVLSAWLRLKAGQDIQQDLFNHLMSLSLDFFNNRKVGELITKIRTDTSQTVEGLETVTRNLIIDVILTIFYLLLLLRTSIQLTAVVGLIAIVQYGLTWLIRRPLRQNKQTFLVELTNLQAYYQEIFSGARVVKSFTAEKYEAGRLAEILVGYVRTAYHFLRTNNLIEPLVSMIKVATNVAVLFFAARELFDGRLSVVGFGLYIYVGRIMLDPLGRLSSTYLLAQHTVVSADRVHELFMQTSAVESGAVQVENFEQKIELQDVTFRYEEEGVLQDVSFEIPHGNVVALVGVSGSGKSTLVDLVLRFYDPQQGRIMIDGVDLRQVDLTSYRKLFGVVAQDSFLFNATIAENIAYNQPDLPPERIEEAAKIANAHEFILRDLPQGYDTLVGDRGVRLSGGQRQRIAIARAVVRKPQILILDEATSSLDSQAEKLVQEAIDRVIKDTTAIVIAHRLSTILNADKIVVMDAGKVADIGTHEELLARCEVYRYLCELQFGSEISAI